MGLLHNILFPKKRQTTSNPPDVNKEYSEEDIAKLIKIRDDADLKLRITRLNPEEKLKLRHMVQDRKNRGRR